MTARLLVLLALLGGCAPLDRPTVTVRPLLEIVR